MSLNCSKHAQNDITVYATLIQDERENPTRVYREYWHPYTVLLLSGERIFMCKVKRQFQVNVCFSHKTKHVIWEF